MNIYVYKRFLRVYKTLNVTFCNSFLPVRVVILKNNNPCWWYLVFEVSWQIEKRVILLLATLQWQLGEVIVNTEDNFPYGKNS